MKHDNDDIPSEVITYALAHCEATVTKIARDSNQPEQELREWVGTLLLTHGTGLINNLSSLRGPSSKMDKTAREMEMDERPYRKTSRKKYKRVAKGKKLGSSRKGFNYNGTHWMQQPKNKKRVKLMMAARRAKYVNGRTV